MISDSLMERKFKARNILLLGAALMLMAVAIVIVSSMEPIDDDDPLGSDRTSASTDDIVFLARDPTSCEDPGCHVGMEPIAPKMDLECPTCHAGDGETNNKTEAHTDMYVNPGAFDVVDDTCGSCHPDQVEAVRKSIHATSAGIISATRYAWGAQDRESVYSNYDVSDDDGDVPTGTGAVGSLEQLPTFDESGNPADDYLRNQCLRCHIWTEGAKRAGDYRSSGCTACHMLYSDEGGYEGDDPTIDRDDPDHPTRHELTLAIPSEQCIHCHNRGGRTGVSYIGTMESDGYGTPFTEGGEKQDKLHGKYYNHLTADIHYQKGMECIDCHTTSDVHGDGNLYEKKEQYVEIECSDCHGTPTEYPWDENLEVLTSGAYRADGTQYGTAGGNEFNNVEKRGETLILTTKLDGVEHEIPLLKTIADDDGWTSDASKVAMTSIPHLETLECYACHAPWVSQCYGCHAKMDERTEAKDWISGGNDANSWSESRSYLRWETPVLGWNAEGFISPYTTGCQVIFTHIDENGNTVELNLVFTTVDGTSGIAYNPIQPHTVSDKPRTCEDCHTNKKTLGVGSGIYDLAANGVDLDFELERIVDEAGNQIQATSHEGARPFNAEEQARISRVCLCVGCHQNYDDPVWADVRDLVGRANTADEHEDIMDIAFNAILGPDPVIILFATDLHDGKVLLNWQASHPDEVDHYDIYWSKDEITNLTGLESEVNTTETHIEVEHLKDGTEYFFAVVGVDAGGNITAMSVDEATPTEAEGHGEELSTGSQLLLVLMVVLLIVFAVLVTRM
jgi:hypothetical protein